MQHIQDKEFDQRIRDQFENEEIQVSASSWQDLERVLHPERKRIISHRWWLAAASVLLLSSLGVYLSYHSGAHEVNKERLALNNSGRKEQIAVIESNNQLNSVPVEKAGTIKLGEIKVSSAPPVAIVKASSKQQDIEPKLQPESVNTVKEEIILSSLQPSSDLARHVDNKTLYRPEKLTVLQEPHEVSSETDNRVEDADQQRGIRNVGDLVNYVVDKVDKRAEKILKFKTDDDNSSLIAINIGMLKFNQKKQK